MKILLTVASTFVLSACITTGNIFDKPSEPKAWNDYEAKVISSNSVQDLKGWWKKFDDQTLNQLIALSLEQSPDRLIAKSRIEEARGIRRTSRSALFPQLDGTATAERRDTGNGFPGLDNTYEAGFDASYEVDIFGRNRQADKAARKNIDSFEEQYYDVTLTLIGDIARNYIEYRNFQKQTEIANTNLEIQQKTLDLIIKQNEFGEAPQLDVERAENLVNTTKASVPEFERQAENARLALSVLVGALPEDLKSILLEDSSIPSNDIEAVLLAPTEVLSLRPDIRAAMATLESSTALSKAAVADLFPQFTLSGFFGTTDGGFANNANIWNITLGMAVSLLDFGRIEGQIDAARAVERRAYQNYRKTILEAVTEVETALNDYARLNERRDHLQNAYNNANQALELSQLLYKEGEVSFIDVLDSQRTLNEADSSLAQSKSDVSQSLVRLYKSLGVY